MTGLLWLVPALPFAGAAILLVLGGRMPRWMVPVIGCGSILASAIVIAGIFAGFNGPYTERLWTWIGVDDFRPEIAFYLDSLSLVMATVVAWVGFLIHLYSAEFMREDPGYSRFFGYMNLFVGSMQTLLLANNLLLLYLGWEGVGLCSYLLIGFWYQDPANGRAVGGWLRPGGCRGAAAGGRRGGQVRATALAGVASRCHGRSYTHVRADSRGHHGDGGGLPHRAHPHAVHPRASGPTGGGHHRRRHAAHGGFQCAGAARHEAYSGLLHREPDRVHVSGARRGRLAGGHLPLHDARFLQSAPVPG